MSATSSLTVQHSQAFLTDSTTRDPTELRIHYRYAKPNTNSKGIILLIHGFPESSHQFRKIIPLLVSAGYHVIAPDYRGHGSSSVPPDSSLQQYTKKQLAVDLYDLIQNHIGIKEKVHIVGYDIGGMIAHAYAAQFPSATASVTWGECPLPGSTIYDTSRHSSTLWHFDFHSHHPDLACELVAGKEAMYLKHFYDRLAMAPEVFTNDDIDFYAMQYAKPGGMRAGFMTYRAFDLDAEDNKKWRRENGKIGLRSLCLNGSGSFIAKDAREMADEFYKKPEVRVVEGSGHWIAEERPEEFVQEVLAFIEADK